MQEGNHAFLPRHPIRLAAARAAGHSKAEPRPRNAFSSKRPPPSRSTPRDPASPGQRPGPEHRRLSPTRLPAALTVTAFTQGRPGVRRLLARASIRRIGVPQGVVAVLALGLLALLGGAAASLVTGSLCVLSNVSVLAFLGASSLVLWRTYRR